ncbi:MAG: alpha/beta fold hydrolase [Steroidobacteraceae bacterium]
MRFILVHGGFHGAWCWDRLVPELEALGHETVAIDLPGHGKRRDEVSTLEGRRDAILEVLRPGDVLVGHSGGGYDVTLAADAAPEKVGHIIYLAAALPLEGRPLIEASGGRSAEEVGESGKTQLMTEETGMMRFIRLTARGRMECCDFDAVRDFFYHDCAEADARWAYSQLSPAPVEFLLEPIHLRNFWKADLPRSYILCLQDRAAPRSLCAGFIERLGVEPMEIDASHSPFLSMPRATAKLFVEATRSLPVRPLRPN